MNNHLKALTNFGFTTIDEVYTKQEIDSIISTIDSANTNKAIFRKSEDLFAIRQFLVEIKEARDLIFNSKIVDLIITLFGHDYFLVKSIYFDKPEKSNWFVSYHQDLTISVDKKLEIAGFGPYTAKQNQFAVQPPISILEHNFTIRIHLDDTNEENGALKVIPKSHRKGIYRPENIDWTIEQEETCNVKSGSLMIMKPLILHRSDRTTNNQRRRVIHLEFSNQMLPSNLKWSEYLTFM